MNLETLDAAIIIIGNEILSGKTQDVNVQHIALGLADFGIVLKEVRVIPDVEEDIISVVNHLREKYTYVFTTGGIGPTHDDITAKTMAKAFGDEFILHKYAKEMMEKHAKEINRELREDHIKMCYMPKRAVPLFNHATGAPGFKLDNVFVMAGVPYIMQAMFEEAKKHLKKGKPIISKSVVTDISEGKIAGDFGLLQEKYPKIEMGSYPSKKNNKWSTTLVLRGSDAELIEKVMQELLEIIERFDKDV
ncbi:MAG: molybdopterin-binding protein [Rickettsiales bacterium]|nr:molybdopterin-binding protein [Rickettsiales bacterium]